MCCLFGMLDYDSNLSANRKNRIVSVLSRECEQRGTDATGISYIDNDKLIILKAPVSAHNFKFNIPRNTNIIMGHTRFTTKGSEKKNFNNHPFMGTAGNTHFALAHNGILYNDTSLKRTENLPDTKIETDSYVAVQLLEKQNSLNFNSIKNMAEKVEGSFSFTIHDNRDNLYFVKGDNPLCIYNFTYMGIYLYASTEDILKNAIRKLHIHNSYHTKLKIEDGDIIRIDKYGNITKSEFNMYKYFTRPYSYYFDDDYVKYLKMCSRYYGMTEKDIDDLLECCYTEDEIEELIYDRSVMQKAFTYEEY